MTILLRLVKTIIIGLVIALGVGFYTLLERKVLSYIQIRKGPNKVGFIGIPQPLADAAKLFTKENIQIIIANKLVFILAPVIAVAIILTLWSLYPSNFNQGTFKLGILFFLCISRLNVYTVLLSGWSSNSKYALLGAIRAVAQTISYEVSIALIIITVLLARLSFNTKEIMLAQTQMPFVLLIFPVAYIWIVTNLAETNRAPFDLAEGESELVSGFNIEYGRGEFAFLFIAEYGRILFIRALTTIIFLANTITSTGILTTILTVLVRYIFLWVRGSYPRIRYDTLIRLTWKSFLTIIITILLLLFPILLY